jgi:predicted 3-demethylubiquinone-9 3-methyltransferase (glyoxalase superfamily)
MQKIVPHLWFDKEAREAASFYEDVFGDGSRVINVTTLHDTPSGDVDAVSFEVWDYRFMSISAGPLFKINPSISFMVNFDPSQVKNARERIDEIWGKLSKEGTALMPLDKYPFSEQYGWIQDRYGVSWQLIYTDPEGEERPLIIPSLLFTGDLCGKAEEATDFYMSVFKDSKRGAVARYPEGMEADREGTLMFTDYKLEDQWFAAMDSAQEHNFRFNEAVSLMVYCMDQKEIDYYWGMLSAVPESEQCGWLKDKYGISWQIAPIRLDEMMSNGSPGQIASVTESFLKMKKFDLAELEKAYTNNEGS